MTIPRASTVIPAAERAEIATEFVTLDYDARYRRRRAMRTDAGVEFLLDLPEAIELRDGDGLRLEDGRVIEVRAATEPVADISARNAHHLIRLAWHLGNRHLPTQIFADKLRIRQDHVIEKMAAGLGAQVQRLEAPFNPEGGAYGHGRTHGHDHGHTHDHSHAHGSSDAHG